MIVDENASAGGQYYRQPRDVETAGFLVDSRQRRGRAKIDEVAAAATLRLGCAVYGLDTQHRVWMDQDGAADFINPRCVLLATGAYDRPVAFPGWTLPGVMAAGSAQALVKSQQVRPGSRAVIAGSGPFLFVVAVQLLKAGVDVVEVVEAATARKSLPHLDLAGSLRYPSRFAELVGYLLPLIRAGTKIRQGEIIASADGDGCLQQVRLRSTSIGGDGPHVLERVIDADLLCVGYGFSASTELARLAGCALAWDEGLHQNVPACDEWQATSVDGVFVAGEACGLGGAPVAECEGELAAIGIARRIGRIQEAEAHRMAAPIRRRLRGLRRFAAVLPALFPTPPQLAELAMPNTIVCRCQNVTFDRVLEAVMHEGAATLNEVKTTALCGMGWCQGRICGSVLPPLLAQRVGTAFDVTSAFTARNPVRPVKVSSLAKLAPSEDARGA
jgi:thioredoxin reductase/bacterioferritin-associated ferredoxin